ncbi:6518_t:CDS:2, partial [Funneliformis mosseae]
NCFIYMIKLAIAIYRIPNSNPFKSYAIQIFNQRYIEFQHSSYLLCYYLHPFYRAFRDVAITASTLWQGLGHSEQECKKLISEFRLTFNEDLLANTNLVLEDFVNLRDPIFQDGENGLREELNIPNIDEENINMDFDSVNLVDDILNVEMD